MGGSALRFSNIGAHAGTPEAFRTSDGTAVAPERLGKVVFSTKKSSKAARKQPSKSPKDLTASQFVENLMSLRSAAELKKIQRYFKSGVGEYGEGDEFIGVRMGQVFSLAKEFQEMPPAEIERLLENPIHEVRTGAVSIMDFQARNKKTTAERKKELFDLYLRRHDRINNWDLVDRSAPYVIGGYLSDKPRKVLYKLARSKDVWERRTAIVSTWYFIRQGDLDDTFKLAEILLTDDHDLIHKAAGGWLREAGKRDRQRLMDFLDKFAGKMPRIFLRYAIEHLDKKTRDYYLGLRNQEK
jgi:3-methyladenine DNA glycosylase AlkD